MLRTYLVTVKYLIFVFTFTLISSGTFAAPAQKSEPPKRPKLPVSYCQAVAKYMGAPYQHIAFRQATLQKNEIKLTFVGHSTFRIESAGGVIIATDFAGLSGQGRLPDIVTMNRAHETHYTNFVDPKIKHVLHGWNDKKGFAFHEVTLDDVRVRNVPTNIRDWSGGTALYGNSIFVFEIAGLCIGHMGHLQHTLTSQQLAQIGQLDVALVPADGIYTMDHIGMAEVVRQLKARLTIPMHFFGGRTLNQFLDLLRPTHEVKIHPQPGIVLSRAGLPKRPEVLVLPGF